MKHLETVFAIVSSRLPAANVHCLLIGGFAVNHYGYSRNTLDVDFMISGDELDRVKQVMTQEGFTNVAVHENVVFFTMPGNPLRIDFLRVDAGTMQRLLSNAVTVRLHEHELKVPALKDLIAMKIFALAQGGVKRQGKDLPDIAYLTVINNLDLESDILPLCDRFGNPRTYTLVKEYVEALQSP